MATNPVDPFVSSGAQCPSIRNVPGRVFDVQGYIRLRDEHDAHLSLMGWKTVGDYATTRWSRFRREQQGKRVREKGYLLVRQKHAWHRHK